MDTFQRENQAVLQVTASLRKVAGAIGEPPDDAAWARLRGALGDTVERLAEIDKHYLRKENQLFPFLEDHGVEGPSKVMWAIHDDIRALIKQARQTIADDDAGLAVSTCLALAKMADDMVTKEEQVLHPMAMDTLSDAEWARIRAGEDDIGYAFITDVPAWPAAGGGPAAPAPRPRTTRPGGSPAGLLDLNTGGLSLDELNLVLGVLPIDFQYVDEHDRVRYYSEGPPDLPAQPGGDRAQGAELPPARERAQGAADHRRVPRRREGHRRVLDRVQGSSCTSATSRCATSGATVAWSRPCRT